MLVANRFCTPLLPSPCPPPHCPPPHHTHTHLLPPHRAALPLLLLPLLPLPLLLIPHRLALRAAAPPLPPALFLRAKTRVGSVLSLCPQPSSIAPRTFADHYSVHYSATPLRTRILPHSTRRALFGRLPRLVYFYIPWILTRQRRFGFAFPYGLDRFGRVKRVGRATGAHGIRRLYTRVRVTRRFAFISLSFISWFPLISCRTLRLCPHVVHTRTATWDCGTRPAAGGQITPHNVTGFAPTYAALRHLRACVARCVYAATLPGTNDIVIKERTALVHHVHAFSSCPPFMFTPATTDMCLSLLLLISLVTCVHCPHTLPTHTLFLSHYDPSAVCSMLTHIAFVTPHLHTYMYTHTFVDFRFSLLLIPTHFTMQARQCAQAGGWKAWAGDGLLSERGGYPTGCFPFLHTVTPHTPHPYAHTPHHTTLGGLWRE